MGNKLILLKQEAANILGYLYQEKIEKDHYPIDLSEYVFQFPQLKKNFNYISDGEFTLEYYVGIKNTSHFYHSEYGEWVYYPN